MGRGDEEKECKSGRKSFSRFNTEPQWLFGVRTNRKSCEHIEMSFISLGHFPCHRLKIPSGMHWFWESRRMSMSKWLLWRVNGAKARGEGINKNKFESLHNFYDFCSLSVWKLVDTAHPPARHAANLPTFLSTPHYHCRSRLLGLD